MYPDPPPALDKYPEFTIGEAQLAAFQCCFGHIVKGRKSSEKVWSLYPDTIQLMKVMMLLPASMIECSGGTFLFTNEKDLNLAEVNHV